MKNKVKDSLMNVIVEKESLNSVKNCIMHFICLLIPVAAAFGGYFLSTPVWKLLNKNIECPQWFIFLGSLILFLIAAVVIFVKTRNTNPVIRIRVSKISDSDKNQ